MATKLPWPRNNTPVNLIGMLVKGKDKIKKRYHKGQDIRQGNRKATQRQSNNTNHDITKSKSKNSK